MTWKELKELIEQMSTEDQDAKVIVWMKMSIRIGCTLVLKVILKEIQMNGN